MLCTNHPRPCLADPMIPNSRTDHRRPQKDDPILCLPYPYARAGFVGLLPVEPIPTKIACCYGMVHEPPVPINILGNVNWFP
jgi:hypothetical protein